MANQPSYRHSCLPDWQGVQALKISIAARVAAARVLLLRHIKTITMIIAAFFILVVVCILLPLLGISEAAATLVGSALGAGIAVFAARQSVMENARQDAVRITDYLLLCISPVINGLYALLKDMPTGIPGVEEVEDEAPAIIPAIEMISIRHSCSELINDIDKCKRRLARIENSYHLMGFPGIAIVMNIEEQLDQLDYLAKQAVEIWSGASVVMYGTAIPWELVDAFRDKFAVLAENDSELMRARSRT